LLKFDPLEAREADTPGKARNGLGHTSRFRTFPRGDPPKKAAVSKAPYGVIILEHEEHDTMVYVLDKNRIFIPKTHALDAVSVGNMDTVVEIAGSKQSTFDITAYGRGAYQRTRLTRKGFPRGTLMRSRSVHGFEIADQAKAVVPKGNKQETYPGPVAVRETGSLNLKTSTATDEGIKHKYCRLIQRGDRLRLVTSSPLSNTSSESNALAPRPERRGLKRMN
jgi:hypothetical protein